MRRDFDINIRERTPGFPRSKSALRRKNKRRVDKYAKSFQFKKYDEMSMGENVQIDHMTVTKHGVVMKHLAGIERFSKHMYTNVYNKANSTNTTKFSKELIENAPYKVRSIKVDEC